MDLGAPAFVLFVGFRHAPGNQLHFGPRSRKGEAGLQPAVNQVVVRMALAELVRTEGERRPKLRVAFRKKRPGRHHTNDRVRFGVQSDALTDDVRVAAKTPMPEIVTQEHNVMVSVNFLLRQEVAAQNRFDTEQREDIRRQE